MTRSGRASQRWTQHKQKKLDRAVQLVGWLLLAASCLCWLAYSVPLWITVCVCLTPWLALALVTFGNGRFLLVGPDGKTVLNIVIGVPMGVMIGALLRFNIIDWEWPFAVACLGGALFLAGCFIAIRSTPKATDQFARIRAREMFLIFIVWLVGAALSWATIVFVNGVRDLRPPTKLSGKVVGKSTSGGRSHSYYLYFSGKPTTLGLESFRTSKARYDRTHIGQTNCVIVGEGLFGLRYYGVKDC